MRRPTFSDIAAQAGLSLATVERVLNGRGGVRQDKVMRVIAAAQRLGYDRSLPDVHRTTTRIELIIARPETTFFTRLVEAFVQFAETMDPNVVLHRTVIAQDAEECVARIRATGLRRAGLIITAPDHPDVGKALQEVQTTGVPVVQLVTHSAGLPSDYVGIDNYAAGRTAAMFLSRMCRRKGQIVVLGPIERFEAHKQRLRGFSDYLGAHPDPELVFSHVIIAREEGAFGIDEVAQILDSGVQVAGFYNCAGLNGPLCDLMRRHPAAREVFYVGHELTDRSRAALLDGTMEVVIDQAPELQARRALDLMLFRLGLVGHPVENPPIRFLIFTAQGL